MMSAILQLTFDGSLVHHGHQVSLRDLSQAMTGLQSAVDRACLDVYYGDVWKHQRLRKEHYEIANFIVGQPRQGSYVIDFVSDVGNSIVERIRQAISDPYGKAIQDGGAELYKIGHQIQGRRDEIERAKRLMTYEELSKGVEPLVTRRYGDKSIAKEINQMLTPVRREEKGLIKLALRPDERARTETFTFDSFTAKNFGEIIKKRELGAPVIYEGYLRELDKGHHKTKNFRGKFINKSNDRDIVIHIESLSDFESLVPYLGGNHLIRVVASPIIEFESFDPSAGDIQFLRFL